jgi:hypothetical protein
MFTEMVVIAAIVSLGLIVGIGGLIRGFVISRQQPHHLATRSGERPVPAAVDIRPPE